jgi:inosine-uridine nucleoside N-ribohydrolase
MIQPTLLSATGPAPVASRLLDLPPRDGRLRVVIDTDAANEIDDPFAVAWALARTDRLRVEAIHVAPFSFAHRRAELALVHRLQTRPGQALSRREQDLLDHHRALWRRQRDIGLDPATWTSPLFDPPAASLERSVGVVHGVIEALGLADPPPVFAGEPTYLGADMRSPSPAAEDLIARAKDPVSSHEPLYVVALGALTNVARALRAEPRIRERLVVVWTAGYPSHEPWPNIAFNLDQDPVAVREVLASGVALVYLPGYHVGAQLRLSRLELEANLADAGRIGRLLEQRWRSNPLAGWLGLGTAGAPSWVLWDLINVAWLLDPEWVPTGLVPTPGLGDDLRWHPMAAAPPMREAWGVQRDAILADLFSSLRRTAMP